MSRVLIILPAYNEAANIERTVRCIRAACPSAAVLVVNDGSTDATGAIAQQAGAMVLHMPYNVGIGAAVQTAFRFAQAHGFEVVVRNDGDGQHDPLDIARIIERLQRGDVDIVIGSRFLNGGDYGTSAARLVGIGVLRWLLSRIAQQPITDPTSGFAAFNTRAIALFAQVYPYDYPEPEAIVLARRAGLRLCEAPARMLPRTGGRSSITPLRSVYYMIKVVLSILINLLRRREVVPPYGT